MFTVFFTLLCFSQLILSSNKGHRSVPCPLVELKKDDNSPIYVGHMPCPLVEENDMVKVVFFVANSLVGKSFSTNELNRQTCDDPAHDALFKEGSFRNYACTSVFEFMPHYCDKHLGFMDSLGWGASPEGGEPFNLTTWLTMMLPGFLASDVVVLVYSDNFIPVHLVTFLHELGKCAQEEGSRVPRDVVLLANKRKICTEYLYRKKDGSSTADLTPQILAEEMKVEAERKRNADSDLNSLLERFNVHYVVFPYVEEFMRDDCDSVNQPFIQYYYETLNKIKVQASRSYVDYLNYLELAVDASNDLGYSCEEIIERIGRKWTDLMYTRLVSKWTDYVNEEFRKLEANGFGNDLGGLDGMIAKTFSKEVMFKELEILRYRSLGLELEHIEKLETWRMDLIKVKTVVARRYFSKMFDFGHFFMKGVDMIKLESSRRRIFSLTPSSRSTTKDLEGKMEQRTDLSEIVLLGYEELNIEPNPVSLNQKYSETTNSLEEVLTKIQNDYKVEESSHSKSTFNGSSRHYKREGTESQTFVDFREVKRSRKGNVVLEQNMESVFSITFGSHLDLNKLRRSEEFKKVSSGFPNGDREVKNYFMERIFPDFGTGLGTEWSYGFFWFKVFEKSTQTTYINKEMGSMESSTQTSEGGFTYPRQGGGTDEGGSSSSFTSSTNKDDNYKHDFTREEEIVYESKKGDKNRFAPFLTPRGRIVSICELKEFHEVRDLCEDAMNEYLHPRIKNPADCSCVDSFSGNVITLYKGGNPSKPFKVKCLSKTDMRLPVSGSGRTVTGGHGWENGVIEMGSFTIGSVSIELQDKSYFTCHPELTLVQEWTPKWEITGYQISPSIVGFGKITGGARFYDRRWGGSCDQRWEYVGMNSDNPGNVRINFAGTGLGVKKKAKMECSKKKSPFDTEYETNNGYYRVSDVGGCSTGCDVSGNTMAVDVSCTRQFVGCYDQRNMASCDYRGVFFLE